MTILQDYIKHLHLDPQAPIRGKSCATSKQWQKQRRKS